MTVSLRIQLETREFLRVISQIKRDHIPRFRNRLIEHVSAQLLEQIQLRTPVDTGQARNGWKLREHTIDNEETTRSITNHVPYIVFLEEGTHESQPHHMVKRSLTVSPAIIRQLSPSLFRETMGVPR